MLSKKERNSTTADPLALPGKEVLKSFHASMRDEMNRFRIGSLFWESRKNDVYGNPLPNFFTRNTVNREFEGETFWSLRNIYFSYDHIPYSEYDFALDVFGSWGHWEALAKSKVFADLVESWRDELTVRLKADAIREILIASKDNPGAIGFQAAKYLADEGYVTKKLGRVSKEEKDRQVKLAARVTDTLTSDFDRLGLKLATPAVVKHH